MLQKFLNYLFKNQVIFALFLIVCGWVLIQLRDILLSLFLSYIIMAAILPFVEYLRKKRFPKLLAVLIPYLGIIFSIFLLIVPLVPFVVNQIQSLIVSFPHYLKQSANILGFPLDAVHVANYLSSQMSSLSSNAFDFTTKVFGGLFSVVTIFIVSFYLLMYHDSFKKFVAGLFQPGYHEFVLDTLERVNEKLGAWLRGQVVLSVFIGTMSWIALTILGLPFALPLSLLAGMLEVVPTLGPTLSAIPAVIVALTISPTMAITVAAIYVLIQAIEGHLLVPNIMQRSVGLNPVVVILAITVGANLMGIVGALLAIPFVSFIIVLFNSWEVQNGKTI